LLRKFVTVQLYTDYEPIASITAEQRQERAEINQNRELDLGEPTNPFYVVLSPGGHVIDRIRGYNDPPGFMQFLITALEKASGSGGEKVAKVDPAPESAGKSPSVGR